MWLYLVLLSLLQDEINFFLEIINKFCVCCFRKQCHEKCILADSMIKSENVMLTISFEVFMLEI